MPIYAYRCAACGHAKDVLQKLSDPVLTQCPACAAEAFSKQLTAAGFQLKGSGWYVTDFREGNKGGTKKEDGAADAADKSEAKPEAKPADKPGADAGTRAAGDKPAATPAAAPAPAPAAAPAAAPAPSASS